MDEEKLILEVQNHKIMYDPSHPFYKDNLKKEMAWKTVAGVMGVDVDLCKAKWRSLRDTFVKNRKKVFASGSAGGSQKKWKYTDIMSFIVPHLQPRSSKSNLNDVLAEERSSTPMSMCGSDEPGPSSASVPQDSQGPQTVSPSLSRPTTSGVRDRPHRSRSPRERVPQGPTVKDTRTSHRPQASDVEERLLSILQEPLPRPESELDESYHFAMSLVPLLHRLDHNRRQQAKIGILNLLQNIESSTASRQEPAAHSSVFHTYSPPTFHNPTGILPRPGTFRPLTQPPPINPIGAFNQMLASDQDRQFGVGQHPYTNI